MGSRYYVTGVQLGMMAGELDAILSGKQLTRPVNEILEEMRDDIEEILLTQCIGEMPNGEPGAARLVVDK